MITIDEKPELTTHRSSRWLLALPIVLIVVVIAVLAARWWSAPDSTWACEGDGPASPCMAASTLDVDALGISPVRLAFEGIDVSPDGRLVALSLHGQVTTDAGSVDRVAVALFATDTGELVRTLRVRESERGAYGAKLAFSPDGTRLVAETTADDEHRLEVIDVATGKVNSTIVTSTDQVISCERVGMSPDNAVVQCNSQLYAAADGTPIDNPDRTSQYAESTNSNSAFSRTGLFADAAFRGAYARRAIRVTDAEGEGESFELRVDAELASRSGGRGLSFNPDATHLVVDFDVETWSWWPVDGPRRNHPATTIHAYDLAVRQVTAEAELGFQRQFIAWSEAGHFALVSRDFEIAVFDPTFLNVGQ